MSSIYETEVGLFKCFEKGKSLLFWGRPAWFLRRSWGEGLLSKEWSRGLTSTSGASSWSGKKKKKSRADFVQEINLLA